MAAKQKALSLKDKVKILKVVDKRSSEYGAKGKIAKEFGIASSTLSTIIKDKKKILDAFKQSAFKPGRKRLRTAAHEDVEEALVIWFKGIRDQSVPVSGSILRAKAEELSKKLGHEQFQCSSGWLQRFKERHAIVQKKICGESASVRVETCDLWIEHTLPTLLDGYELKNVFNADETGLFYKLLPNKTLCFKNQPCHGGKHSKDRVTVLVGAHADGSEKLPLLVIGKSKKPRCFKNVNSLPVVYDASKKAWMNSTIFELWLRQLDSRFAHQQREVLLLLDNCPAHPVVEGLTSIKVVMLPANATSKLQPMDQGIINNLKALYRNKVLSKLICSLDRGADSAVTLLDALHYISAAWEGISQTTVQKCFQRCGIGRDLEQGASDDNASWQSEIDQQLEHLRHSGVAGLEDITPEDYITVDREVMVAEELTTESIVAQVRFKNSGKGEEMDDEPDDTEEEVAVTLPEALASIDKVRRYFQAQEGTTQFFAGINALEKFMEKQLLPSRQTMLTDYFSFN